MTLRELIQQGKKHEDLKLLLTIDFAPICKTHRQTRMVFSCRFLPIRDKNKQLLNFEFLLEFTIISLT